MPVRWLQEIGYQQAFITAFFEEQCYLCAQEELANSNIVRFI